MYITTRTYISILTYTHTYIHGERDGNRDRETWTEKETMFYIHCRSAPKLICNPKWPWISDSFAFTFQILVLQVHTTTCLCGAEKKNTKHTHKYTYTKTQCVFVNACVGPWLTLGTFINYCLPYIYWSKVFWLNSELTDLPSLVSSLALTLPPMSRDSTKAATLRGCWIKGLLADCHTHVNTGNLNSGP